MKSDQTARIVPVRRPEGGRQASPGQRPGDIAAGRGPAAAPRARVRAGPWSGPTRGLISPEINHVENPTRALPWAILPAPFGAPDGKALLLTTRAPPPPSPGRPRRSTW